MTEERQPSSSTSMLHSMLNRFKSSERPQGSSHVTAEPCRHSRDTNQSDRTFIPETDKPEWNFAMSKCSVKPEGQNDADLDSVYFTERTVFQESSPTSTTFLKSGQPSNLLQNSVRDARQDLQVREGNALLEEEKEGQTSQAESHFSILKNSSPHGLYTNDPTRSSLSNSEPRLVKGTAVSSDYEIMNHPCGSENTVSHCVHSALCQLHSLRSIDISFNLGNFGIWKSNRTHYSFLWLSIK